MIPVVELVVDMLPLDPPGRRAVDETLADWRHEVGEARTMAGRLVAGARGAAAVTVAVASVAVRDVTSASTFGIAGAVAGAACLMSIGFTYRTFESYAAELSQLGLADARLIGLWASLLPPAVAFCIPLALLAPPVRRVATRSLIGPCVVLMAISAFNLGWIVPQANQRFRETSWAMFRPAVPEQLVPRSVARGIAEYTVADLVREVRQGGAQSRRATATLNSGAVLLAMVPVCLVLGVQARRLGTVRRWRVGAGLLAWVTFATAILVSIATAGSLRLFSMWLVPLVCAAIAFGLARLVSATTTRHDEALRV
jgi:hypothetical protein